MQPQDTSGVQYSRWNDNQDQVSVSTSPAATSKWNRVYTVLCTGKCGFAVKAVGCLALFWVVFIMGYLTGYYVHKCK